MGTRESVMNLQQAYQTLFNLKLGDRFIFDNYVIRHLYGTKYQIKQTSYRPVGSKNKFGKYKWKLVTTKSILSTVWISVFLATARPQVEGSTVNRNCFYSDKTIQGKQEQFLEYLQNLKDGAEFGDEHATDRIEHYAELYGSIDLIIEDLEQGVYNYSGGSGNNQFKQKVSDNLYKSMFGLSSKVANK